METVRIADLDQLLDDRASRAALEQLVLPRYLGAQRWFGAKSRILAAAHVHDVARVTGPPDPGALVVVRAEFADGGIDLYVVPMALFSPERGAALAHERPDAVLARVESPSGEAVLVDATVDDRFCRALLGMICGFGLTTADGQIRGEATTACAALMGGRSWDPIGRGSVEQSNTTIQFGGAVLLKLFRRLVPGINPDFEVGRFLTERTYGALVPKTAGALTWQTAADAPATLAVVQEFVPSEGQAWVRMLDLLARFYEDATHSGLVPETLVPGAVDSVESPPEVGRLLAASLRSSARLGQRTGALHLALASDPDAADFAPEPIQEADLGAIRSSLERTAAEAFHALRCRRDSLAPDVQALVDDLNDWGPDVVRQVIARVAWQPGLRKIRCHGDYHLGQVLWQSDDDFVILDFEGEPGRSVAERRAKQSPFKDVAGMLRSFEYVAHTALIHRAGREPDSPERLKAWADVWRASVSSVFLDAYGETVAPGALLPDPPEAAARLLDVFMLEKLLFELRYELDYRPSWVRVPLLGMARWRPARP